MNKVQNLNPTLPKPDSHVYYKNRRIPKDYMEVAKGMETQFINHMLEELTKNEGSLEDQSFSTKYYKSLLNQERAEIMAANENSIGLKDMVLDQLLPQSPPPANNMNSINAYRAISKQGGENE